MHGARTQFSCKKNFFLFFPFFPFFPFFLFFFFFSSFCGVGAGGTGAGLGVGFGVAFSNELISTSLTGPFLSKALLMSFLKAAGHWTTLYSRLGSPRFQPHSLKRAHAAAKGSGS